MIVIIIIIIVVVVVVVIVIIVIIIVITSLGIFCALFFLSLELLSCLLSDCSSARVFSTIPDACSCQRGWLISLCVLHSIQRLKIN